MDNYRKPEFIFSLLDLTSLDATDTSLKIKSITEKIMQLTIHTHVLPAAVCTYPVFTNQVKEGLKNTPVLTAAVSGGFPTGMTFTKNKVEETRNCIEAGADEVDIVINRGRFIEGDIEFTFNEILAMKNACGGKALKVILETGELRTTERIVAATETAAKAGADFVKTSTGKSAVSATPEAVIAICKGIRSFYEDTGKQIGCKVSGGIATYEDALVYIDIISSELGEEWMRPSLFRIGASRLANDLLERLEVSEVRF